MPALTATSSSKKIKPTLIKVKPILRVDAFEFMGDYLGQKGTFRGFFDLNGYFWEQNLEIFKRVLPV